MLMVTAMVARVMVAMLVGVVTVYEIVSKMIIIMPMVRTTMLRQNMITV